jgi:hypothetical protein
MSDMGCGSRRSSQLSTSLQPSTQATQFPVKDSERRRGAFHPGSRLLRQYEARGFARLRVPHTYGVSAYRSRRPELRLPYTGKQSCAYRIKLPSNAMTRPAGLARRASLVTRGLQGCSFPIPFETLRGEKSKDVMLAWRRADEKPPCSIVVHDGRVCVLARS